MELDQLKNIWQKEPAAEQKQDEYLLSLLAKRSNSPIAKMKRNLFWELTAVIVLYGAGIVYYFLAFDGKMVELSWFMLAIGILFLVYYYRKNKLLNGMQCVACQVKSNLELQLGTLEKYVRFYLVAGNILVPVSMLIVGYVAIILYPQRLHSSKLVWNDPDMQRIAIIFLIAIIAISVGTFFLNKWYVNRLYGRHITRLKQMLKELAD
jgi:Flp pilus assembly protein TadB